MTILNIGSVNIAHVSRVPHHPAPGETLAASDYQVFLGGKGANMSLAAAMAGAEVRHAGAIGAEGAWCRDRLDKAGVDVSEIVTVGAATGHAIINVDDAGENVIVIHAGANRALTEVRVDAAVARCAQGDWLLLQNETNLVPYAAKAAKSAGLSVAYAAAPFDPDATAEVLPYTDLLALNAIEAGQLAAHLGVAEDVLPAPEVLITRGAEGATL
jgi:ribokinase